MTALLERQTHTTAQRRSGGSGPLGVLGGMGPLATARFAEALVSATPARTDQEHLRTVIWSDPSTPDRSAAVLGTGPSPLAHLLRGAEALRRLGAAYLAAPCNTVHAFLPRVSAETGLQLIDMVDETVASVIAEGTDACVVLGTRGTREAGLYERAGRRHGVTIHYPGETAQAFVDNAIALVKSGGDLAQADVLIAEATLASYASGLPVVAACTEIPVVAKGAGEITRVFDSIECLARACVRTVHDWSEQ